MRSDAVLPMGSLEPPVQQISSRPRHPVKRFNRDQEQARTHQGGFVALPVVNGSPNVRRRSKRQGVDSAPERVWWLGVGSVLLRVIGRKGEL